MKKETACNVLWPERSRKVGGRRAIYVLINEVLNAVKWTLGRHGWGPGSRTDRPRTELGICVHFHRDNCFSDGSVTRFSVVITVGASHNVDRQFQIDQKFPTTHNIIQLCVVCPSPIYVCHRCQLAQRFSGWVFRRKWIDVECVSHTKVVLQNCSGHIKLSCVLHTCGWETARKLTCTSNLENVVIVAFAITSAYTSFRDGVEGTRTRSWSRFVSFSSVRNFILFSLVASKFG